MEERKIYEDIARRTDGDIYIGVVGPVRTGKSTFIKRVMESLVIPNIDNVYRRERARDELPQSGSGRTIMTAEPKFVPEEAVTVSMDASAAFQVRLIDCVGYMVPGAVGQLEGETERMVTTPWFDHEIPMSEAAEVGTRKVIAEHSTIGIVVTTDGTITEIPREDYLEAEERVIRELKELGKPFLVLLNSAHPNSQRTQAIRDEIAQRHQVTCVAANCLEMEEEDVSALLKQVLYDTPYPNEEKETPYAGFSYEAIIPVDFTLHLTSPADIRALFQMTPYCWKTPRAGVERMEQLETLNCQASFHIHVFQKRSPAALSHTDSLKFTFKTYKAPGSFEPGALLSSFYQ